MKRLMPYLDYEFSSGPYTGSDYISFQTKYINYLKSICKNNNWNLIKTSKNHYCFSTFIKYNDKFVYLSISDVRYFQNEWFNNILIRTANNERDYHGGMNNYTNLKNLVQDINKLFNR